MACSPLDRVRSYSSTGGELNAEAKVINHKVINHKVKVINHDSSTGGELNAEAKVDVNEG